MSPDAATLPPAAPDLWLRGQPVGGGYGTVMAIINRTADSFYPGARDLEDSVAYERIDQVVAQGTDIIDIGAVRAGVGPSVEPAEELSRLLPVIEYIREHHPQVMVSVDTWRSQVAREVIAAGADLINDTWSGFDPDLLHVAARGGVGVVCSHTGGAVPRTDPVRVAYQDVAAQVCADLAQRAQIAVQAGVDPRSVLVDPTHDFGKNTWHSLELMRSVGDLVALGYPVLMALSRKDFIGESLDVEVDERLEGTLSATAVAAWQGARVFRCHDVQATRRVVDMVGIIRKADPPRAVSRALI